MKIFCKLGLEDCFVGIGVYFDFWFFCDGWIGEYLLCIKLGDFVKSEYGVFYIIIYWGDFYVEQIVILFKECLYFDYCLIDIEECEDYVLLSFVNGKQVVVKLVIGVDGINLVICEKLLGVEKLCFLGWIGYCVLVDMDKLCVIGLEYECCVKWWWEQLCYIMVYVIKGDDSEYYYVIGVFVDSWNYIEGFVDSLCEEMEVIFGDNVYLMVCGLIDVMIEVMKWLFWNCDLMSLWSQGCLCMLGDVCYFMCLYMVQGVCMVIEDVVVLVCLLILIGVEDYKIVFKIYENVCCEWVIKVQIILNVNIWLKQLEDLVWVYVYDLLMVELI